MNIFISHSAEDRETAEHLARGLEETGHQVWSPETGVLPGDNWAVAVGHALEEAEAIVVLLSEASLRSQWVRHEISYALGNERFEGRLLPVVIGSAERLPEEQVPWSLRSLSWISLEPGKESETARRIANALSPAFA